MALGAVGESPPPAPIFGTGHLLSLLHGPVPFLPAVPLPCGSWTFMENRLWTGFCSSLPPWWRSSQSRAWAAQVRLPRPGSRGGFGALLPGRVGLSPRWGAEVHPVPHFSHRSQQSCYPLRLFSPGSPSSSTLGDHRDRLGGEVWVQQGSRNHASPPPPPGCSPSSIQGAGLTPSGPAAPSAPGTRHARLAMVLMSSPHSRLRAQSDTHHCSGGSGPG